MAGYSGTPLLKKLGIKPGHTILVLNEPTDYWKWLSPLPDDVVVKEKLSAGANDFIHLFVTEKKVYEKEVLRCRKSLKQDGMIWVSWPKKSSAVVTDMNEDVIRDFALKNSLVDIKVCAVDEVWSGLKLVIPVKDRKK
jgi:hypothetical protein